MSTSDLDISTPPPITAGAVSHRIAGPMPCVQCHYDLRNLGAEQPCPECGTPVARTLASPAAASSADLLRLRRGLSLIAIAMIAGTAWLMIGQFFVLILAFGSMGGTGSSVPVLVIMSIVPAVSIMLAILSAFGWSRITMSITSMHADRARTAAAVRRLAWAFAVLYVCSGAGLIAMQLLGAISAEASVAGVGIVIATFAVWTARTALGVGLLAVVARASCAMKTDRVFRVLGWGAIALPTVLAVTTICTELLELESMAGVYLEYLIGGATLLLGLVIIALGVMALVLRSLLRPFASAASLRSAGAA